MTKKEFDDKLEENGLTRQAFAQLTGVAFGSVTNWHDERKPIPSWVPSWLQNYTKSKALDAVSNAVKPYI